MRTIVPSPIAPLRVNAMRSRLDVEMTRRGLADSREGAQRLIMAGRVRVNSRPAAKPDLKVAPDTIIDVVSGLEYASRGGLKLAAALNHFAIDVIGKRVLDVGASTGGFTDVLLRAWRGPCNRAGCRLWTTGRSPAARRTRYGN